MSKHSIRRFAFVGLAVLLVGVMFLGDSAAQRRRRRHRSTAPRITNPAIYQPANENANANSGETTAENTNATSTNEDPEAMKKSIRTLSSQVDRLSEKLGQMEESQRSLVDLERLSRAEQRSAQLRSELHDTLSKESDLQARAEDLDYALKPENIERATPIYGSTHPEEMREQRRRQLQSERERVQKQLDQLAANRARLEQAIAASDVEAERLRKRLDAADAAAVQNAKTNNGSSSQAAPRPSPSPYPTP